MRSRIEPMKKIARTLRAHRALLLNYFQTNKQFSSGVVEGLHNKAKVTLRESYRSRTFRKWLGRAGMDVHLDVPEEVARLFAAEPGGITRVAIEGVRSGKLTIRQAREMLGIRSRYEMDGSLKAHDVPLKTTLEQVAADSEIAIAFSK